MKPIRIGLYTGGTVAISDDGIDVSAVRPEDIAHGLSNVGRFGGQPKFMYSVGEHSVRLAQWARRNGESPAVRLALLLHDAPECLGVGDVQRFVKRKYASRLREFDDEVTRALWLHLRPAHVREDWLSLARVVHRYDRPQGAYEAMHFGFPYDEADMHNDSVPSGLLCVDNLPDYWSASAARSHWLNAWAEAWKP